MSGSRKSFKPPGSSLVQTDINEPKNYARSSFTNVCLKWMTPVVFYTNIVSKYHRIAKNKQSKKWHRNTSLWVQRFYHKWTKAFPLLKRILFFRCRRSLKWCTNCTLLGESVRTSWRVEMSGGLLGNPSSSETVPASSVFFPVITSGGDPSLMFCCSWSCG